jgi:uncharacterized membrane protein
MGASITKTAARTTERTTAKVITAAATAIIIRIMTSVTATTIRAFGFAASINPSFD